MVYVHSSCAPPKYTKKCMVRHVACDGTQRRAFETTSRIGRLNRQHTSRSTG